MAWWKSSIRTCMTRNPGSVRAFRLSGPERSRPHQSLEQGKAAIANSMLTHSCHSVEDLEDARRLLSITKARGAKPDPSCYYTLLDGCCKFGSPEEVTAVMDEMEENGAGLDDRAYGLVIASFAKARMLDKATEVFQSIRKKNAVMARSLCLSMVWIYCQADRPKDAEEFLKVTEEEVGRDDDDQSVSYNIVISAYDRLGCYDEATRIFQEMKKRKKKKIGQSTYKLLLDIYLKSGDHSSFNLLFREMLAANIFGEASTLEAAVDLYASKSMIQDAEWLYQSLSRSGNRLTIRGYNKLLELFVAAGNVTMVDRIYREMPRAVPADATTRQLVLRAYLRAGSFRGAVELHQEILSESDGEQQLVGDAECLEALVRAYVRVGKFFDAMKLLVSMRKAGHRVDDDVYTQVVAGMVSVET